MHRRAEEDPAESPVASGERSRVVQAADRFRTAVAGRPWQRSRRVVLLAAISVVLVIAAALASLLYVPALQVHEYEVRGTTYVDQKAVAAILESYEGEPLLTVGTGRIVERIEAVPGVASAQVDRQWPDTVVVRVTEREAVATLKKADGAEVIVDRSGAELPGAAGQGKQLVPMAVGAGAKDAEAATETMLEVLAALPDSIKGSVQSVSATSRSDATLQIAPEGAQPKKVIWGDAADGEIKAKVVQALLKQPGSVIDVSAPTAPVTR